MAISKKTVLEMAKRLKMDEAAVSAAYDAPEERDVEISNDLLVLTTAEAATRDRNKYNEGKTAGEEMIVKDIMEENGITVPAGTKKDKAAMVAGIKQKTLDEANVTTDEKVKERDKTINQLRQNLTAKEQEVTTYKTQAEQVQKDRTLLGLLPKNRDDRFSDDQYLMLVKSEFELTEHEGKPAVMNVKTKEIYKKGTDLTPIKPEEVFTTQFAERKWVKEDQQQQQQQNQKGGRGGQDQGFKPGSITNMKQFNQHLADNNINPNGKQAQTLLQQITTANADFDMTAE